MPARKSKPIRKSKAQVFLSLAQPNKETGFSDPVPIDVLKEHELGLGNGGSWCRDDSSLGREYNVERIKEGGRIVAVRLHGYQKNPIRKPIPKLIQNKIQEMRCVVLGTSNPECDHKDGRRDDPRLNDPKKVSLADFQPLSKAANNAKRQHCAECRSSDKRFDARRLGFKRGQWAGNGRYMGTCVGCYWHDPKRFAKEAPKWSK